MNDIVILLVNSKTVSSEHIEAAAPEKYSLNEPQDNSLNEGTRVDNTCEPPFRFAGDKEQSRTSNSANPKPSKQA